MGAREAFHNLGGAGLIGARKALAPETGLFDKHFTMNHIGVRKSARAWLEELREGGAK